MTFAQWCGFLSLLLMASVLWQIRQILLLLFAAVVLANGLNQFANGLQRRGLKRGTAILVAIATLIVSLGAIGALIVPTFINQFQELQTLVPSSIDQTIIWLRQTAAQIDPELTQLLPTWQQLASQVQPLVQQVAGRGLNVFYSTLGLPLSLLLLLVLSFMLLADPMAYRQGLIRCVPAFYRHRLDCILARCEMALSYWLGLVLVSAITVTLMTLLGLMLLQVRLPLALAFLTGVMVMIPNIGLLISVVPALAIALLDSPWKSVGVLTLYLLIHYLDNRWLVPLCVRKPPPILRGVLLLSQMFLSSIFGVLGLWLAVPLTLVGQVLIQEILVKDILDRSQPAALKGE
ncbi:MAG: AI-2E family transporter [Synechocystis sp.]|nr:AI-2E family transporter [Synechocystis sp.]